MDSFEDFLKKSKEYGISQIKPIKDFGTDKKEFDRTKFYLEYYKNLSPENFQIEIQEDKICITIPKG
jgi:type III secretory pathway component EscR